jgi:hypothetical protein
LSVAFHGELTHRVSPYRTMQHPASRLQPRTVR